MKHLMTAEEWASLSPESRHAINLYEQERQQIIKALRRYTHCRHAMEICTCANEAKTALYSIPRAHL